MVLPNTGTFLRGLKLCGESRTQQVLFVCKKKIGDNHPLFGASIWKRTLFTLLGILQLFTNIVDKLALKNAWLLPIFFLDFNKTCKDLLFPHIRKPGKNTFGVPYYMKFRVKKIIAKFK